MRKKTFSLNFTPYCTFLNIPGYPLNMYYPRVSIIAPLEGQALQKKKISKKFSLV